MEGKEKCRDEVMRKHEKERKVKTWKCKRREKKSKCETKKKQKERICVQKKKRQCEKKRKRKEKGATERMPKDHKDKINEGTKNQQDNDGKSSGTDAGK